MVIFPCILFNKQRSK